MYLFVAHHLVCPFLHLQGVFSNYTATPSYFFPATASDNGYLAGATIAAASSASNWVPGWAYSDQGLNGTTYPGNFLSGYGGAVGLTWTAQGLQYVDAGFPLGILCKGYLAPLPPAPPPVNTTNSSIPPPLPPASPLPTTNTAPTASSTPRAPGSTYVYFPVSATLFMSYAGCSNVAQFPSPFSYQFSDATAFAWNKTQNATGASNYILVGDVVLLTGYPITTCGAAPSGRKLAETSSRRALLQSSSSGGTLSGPSVAVSANVNLPPGVSLSTATALQSQFQAACLSAYTSSQFASNYGITGASVTVSSPQSAVYNVPSSSSNNNLAIGLGVGLGVGIPLIAGAGFAAYWFTKKSGAGSQEVAPA